MAVAAAVAVAAVMAAAAVRALLVVVVRTERTAQVAVLGEQQEWTRQPAEGGFGQAIDASRISCREHMQ